MRGSRSRVSGSFHAENIEGIRAHCEAGHLLCRQKLMEAIPDAYTHFESDPYDVAYGFDVRVFGNIYDLGAIHARANLWSSQNPAAPNIYGPIVPRVPPRRFLGDA